MSFHERLMLLVDAEYDSRYNNNIKRLIKSAKFSDSSAFLGNIDYLPDRHLNQDLLELMEYHCGQASTIFCSQFMLEGWHERLGGSALADSILDRLIPSAYIIWIDGDVSMRQRKRMIKD